MIENSVAAIESLPSEFAGGARLAFTTHSIPLTQAETSGPNGGAYVSQHLEVARLVAEGASRTIGREAGWDLVYQSRSGPPASRGSSRTSPTTCGRSVSGRHRRW